MVPAGFLKSDVSTARIVQQIVQSPRPVGEDWAQQGSFQIILCAHPG